MSFKQSLSISSILLCSFVFSIAYAQENNLESTPPVATEEHKINLEVTPVEVLNTETKTLIINPVQASNIQSKTVKLISIPPSIENKTITLARPNLSSSQTKINDLVLALSLIHI